MSYIKGFFYIKLKNFTLNITFNFQNQGLTFIAGESGSGKTTFFKCITGLIKPQKSYLVFNKTCFQNSKNNIFIKPNKRKIGLIFQNPYLFPHLTGLENLILGHTNLSKKKPINKIINFLKLEKLLNRNILTLSGGEKQRIVIGQTLLTHPNLLLLDEPFSSQDIRMKKSILSYLKVINKNFCIPIICICHTINDIYSFGNNLIYIQNGKIIYTENIK